MKNKSDMLLLLLLLYLQKQIKGRTRFQKTVCVLKHKFGVDFSFKFRSYYYGPYSKSLSDALSLLHGTNLVRERSEKLGVGIVRYNYQLTEKGEEIASAIASKMRKDKCLAEFQRDVDEIRQIPTPELISLSKKSLYKKSVRAS